MTQHYRLFGLSFASEQQIPGLEPAAIAVVKRPDAWIRFGDVPPQATTDELLGMGVKASSAGLYIDVPETARFQVSADEIVVEPLAANARDFLLGTALGALLHQRGYLPLHANVVEWNGRAYAFAGASGAGKSTLAARLHARGYGFLSDDLCALSWQGAERPNAWPGIPRVKLWRDALDRLSIDETTLRPLAWTTEKFEAPVTYQVGQESLPLAAVYDLREEDDDASRGVYRLTGVDAVNTLVAHTYRRRFIDFQGASAAYLRRVVRFAQTIPVFVVRRRWGYDEFDQELGAIHDSVTAVAASIGS